MTYYHLTCVLHIEESRYIEAINSTTNHSTPDYTLCVTSSVPVFATPPTTSTVQKIPSSDITIYKESSSDYEYLNGLFCKPIDPLEAMKWKVRYPNATYVTKCLYSRDEDDSAWKELKVTTDVIV